MSHSATIRELARQLEVSEMTIRRDLDLLDRNNIVELVHSGAVLYRGGRTGGEPPKYTLSEAGTVRAAEKMRIGAKAASLIEKDDIVILDCGSTTECVAKNLPSGTALTLLCYSLNILVQARRHEECRLVFAGGLLHENTLMFESPEGVEMIKRYRANKSFISASGVSGKLGVTCSNPYEVETKKASLSSSLSRILLVDSSKFGKIQVAYFADLDDFDMVISDSRLSEEYRETIEDLGIALLTV
jgi:DeoR family deoxyribose operon repressor